MNDEQTCERLANTPASEKRLKNALCIVVLLAFAAVASGSMILALSGSSRMKLTARLDGFVGYVTGYIAGIRSADLCEFDFRSRSPEYLNAVLHGYDDSRKP
jgi:hypothetical protein